MGRGYPRSSRRKFIIRTDNKLHLTMLSVAGGSVACIGTIAFDLRDLILICGPIGMELCPQRTTGTHDTIPPPVCPIFGRLGFNVLWCQFPLDLPGLAFLQPHDLSFCGVDSVGPRHWNRLSIRVWQGSSRTPYVSYYHYIILQLTVRLL